MKPTTSKILLILLDLKNAFLTLIRENLKTPSLINIYTFIDICAFLSNDSKTQNREIFINFIETFMMKDQVLPFTPIDLWAARSSVVHSLSPLGYYTKDNRAKPIFYFHWPEKREEVEAMLSSKGHKEYILLNISELKSYTIWAYNNLHREIENNAEFEELIIKNGENILSNLTYEGLVDELETIEKLKSCFQELDANNR